MPFWFWCSVQWINTMPYEPHKFYTVFLKPIITIFILFVLFPRPHLFMAISFIIPLNSNILNNCSLIAMFYLHLSVWQCLSVFSSLFIASGMHTTYSIIALWMNERTNRFQMNEWMNGIRTNNQSMFCHMNCGSIHFNFHCANVSLIQWIHSRNFCHFKTINLIWNQ